MPVPPENLSLFTESACSSHPDPFFFEGLVRRAGYSLIAGVDEAGRGPLAGPVVAAAVILSDQAGLEGVKDSKRMTPKARNEAFGHILNQAKAVGVGVVSPKDIDQCNILKASLEAMKRAVLALDPQPEFCLVDGTHRFLLALPQGCLIRGDQRSRSISAASVVAKVYRDRIMNAYHSLYSVYGFDRNKGYGTRAHLSALIQHGPCPVHRLTFAGVR